MLVGSVLGGAVRSEDVVTVPGPNQHPSNHLPGAPLATEPGEGRGSSAEAREDEDKPSPSASRTAEKPREEASTPPPADTVRESGQVAGTPSETQGTGQQPPTEEQPAPPPSSGTTGPTSTGGSGSGGPTGGSDPGGDTGSNGGGVIGGLLG
jgi:hypothetical protein